MAKKSGVSKSKSAARRKVARSGKKIPKLDLRSKVAKFLGTIWADDELRARFRADPRPVLKKYGLSVPDGVNIVVVEDTKDTMHVVIPRYSTRTVEKKWPPEDDGSPLTVGKSINP